MYSDGVALERTKNYEDNRRTVELISYTQCVRASNEQVISGGAKLWSVDPVLLFLVVMV